MSKTEGWVKKLTPAQADSFNRNLGGREWADTARDYLSRCEKCFVVVTAFPHTCTSVHPVQEAPPDKIQVPCPICEENFSFTIGNECDRLMFPEHAHAFYAEGVRCQGSYRSITA